MTDKLESIIRELAAVKVKIDNVCAEVRNLAKKIEKDHDTILNHEGRITNLENWTQKHEKQHHFFMNLKYTTVILVIGGAAGALFGWLFSWLPHP